MTLNIGLKEGKLKHICDLVAKTGGIPVERIIPDRAAYYITDDASMNVGFVNPDTFKAKWSEKINPNPSNVARDGIADKVKFTTNKMKKKLDESLGMTVNTGINSQKMAGLLSTLIEFNTVQVVHMIFAKPRNIWYSPDLRVRLKPNTSKWIFFQLEKPEIISGRAFEAFKRELVKPVDDDVGGVSSRLVRILDKNTTTIPPIEVP